MTKKQKRKSNRAQADYFELLVCQYICYKFSVVFSYGLDLAKLSNKVLSLPDGKDRLKLQNNNAIKIQPTIDEILNREIIEKGKIINVFWVGRKFVVEATSSDIDAEHQKKKKTRFSVKSIAKVGKGTLKNIGLGRIQKYFQLDFKKQNEDMWRSLREFLKDDVSSKTQISNIVKKDRILLKWAIKNGHIYQRQLNNLSIKRFNTLSLDKKIEFLNFITDCQDKDLYVIVVNSKSVFVYKPSDQKTNLIKDIRIKKDATTNVGYIICVDNIPTYRVQTNCTNGIGISPFCQRVFWV